MTEPLGRSQVLEYLIDLSRENKIFLISFEREHDFDSIDEIKGLIKDHNIEWDYMIYSNKYRSLSTGLQIISGIRLGAKIIKAKQIDVIHTRSMIPAMMGAFLKKLYGPKLLFDIRGFATDEKVDRNRIKKESLLYNILQKIEINLYSFSDHIVSLTHAAKEIIASRYSIDEKKITVIPTCANGKIFRMISDEEKSTFKKELGFSETDKIIIHTGTVSGWYLFEDEVKMVKSLIDRDPTVKFLLLNKGEHDFIKKHLQEKGFSENSYLITSAVFQDVYKYLNISDAAIYFIKPVFSKQASAPTKFAEMVACQLPSITNTGVGDMEYYLNQYNVGILVDLNESNKEKTVDEIIELLYSSPSKKEQQSYKELFSNHFDKIMAVEKYNEIYKKLNHGE